MKMERLTVNSEKKLNMTNWVRIGDLSYFEGPLLSLFKALNNGHFYLFDWVDRDIKTNRWMIYQVSRKDLSNYLESKISHLDIFNKRPSKSVFVMDIDAENRPFHYYNAYELKTIPDCYLPNEEIFFDVSDCHSFEKIKSLVINSQSRQKSQKEDSGFLISIMQKIIPSYKAYNNPIILKPIYSNLTTEVVKKVTFSLKHLNDLKYSEVEISLSQTLEIKKSKVYANQYH